MATIYIDVPNEIASLGQRAVDRYLKWCDDNGGEPVGKFQMDLAIMFARQRACGANETDRAFQEGRNNGESIGSMHPRMQKILARRYKKLTGMSLPSGAQYLSQAAKKPLDPRAIVESVADVKRINEQRRIEADKTMDAIAKNDTPRKRLGGHVLQHRVYREMKKPENFGKSVREVAESVVDKHGYNSRDTSEK